MRRLLLVAVMVGFVGGHAAAERRRNTLAPPPLKSCGQVASQLVAVVDGIDNKHVRPMLVHRCTKDRWSRETKACFAAVTTRTQASLCLDTLSRTQRKAVEGDADRLNDTRLSRWLFRRSLIAEPKVVIAPASPRPYITLASFDTRAELGRLGKARTLHTQGLSAYKAGRYELAVDKFEAALDAAPTPELLYHAAQAHRLNGDRAEALEHYERYIELEPDGPAANACRAQIERLHYVP